jgi:hypothetical protein
MFLLFSKCKHQNVGTLMSVVAVYEYETLSHCLREEQRFGSWEKNTGENV